MKKYFSSFLMIAGAIACVTVLIPGLIRAANPGGIIGSPMQVVNTIAQWIPIRNLDEPAHNYVQLSPSLPTGHSTTFVLANLYTVPEGHTLVIDDLSGHCDAIQGMGYAYLALKIGNNYQNAYFPGSVSAKNSARWTFHATTKIFAPGGTVVFIGFKSAFENQYGDMACEPSLSGHLVAADWTPAQ